MKATKKQLEMALAKAVRFIKCRDNNCNLVCPAKTNKCWINNGRCGIDIKRALLSKAKDSK